MAVVKLSRDIGSSWTVVIQILTRFGVGLNLWKLKCMFTVYQEFSWISAKC